MAALTSMLAIVLVSILALFAQLAEASTRGFVHSFAPDNTISTCGKLTTYMMKGAYVSADVWSHYQLSCNDAFHFINVTAANPPYTNVHLPIIGVCDELDKRCRGDTILLTTASWQYYDPKGTYDFFMVDWAIDRYLVT
ncbi:hypothetical protein K525DRAFT_284441 [Schizophyllum commune Loenen D]|nr:hypothetical protein K525DRAFT_284441 [Schizophyllum commune Loenen D]